METKGKKRSNKCMYKEKKVTKKMKAPLEEKKKPRGFTFFLK